jgi:hypothetical protein
MDTVPGADTLGFGFDIIKKYDETSATQRIFKEGAREASQITIGKTVYAVPANVAVIIRSESDGVTKAYSSREQVQSYFSAKAGVTASGFGFEGQFEAAYSFVSESDKSYSYGLTDAWNRAFMVSLKDQGRSMLTEDFAADLDSLPPEFTKATEHIYFAFFDTYGTHYVHQVQLGGSLYYYVAIEKSHVSTEEQIRAKMEAEYKAVFAKTKVEAEAEWKKVGKEWAESRTVHLHTVGGDSSIEGLTPSFGDWKGDFLQKWTESLANKPGQTGFNLQPISKLAPLAKRGAMDLALKTYVGNGLSVKATREVRPQDRERKYYAYPTIRGPHGVIAPVPEVPLPPRRDDDVDGLQIVLLDVDTLKPLFNHAYYVNPANIDNVKKMYGDILADVKKITADDFYCAISVFGLSPIFFPPPELRAWLESCGAALTQWQTYIGKTSFAGGAICYTFAGRKLTQRGKENFTFDPYRNIPNVNGTTQYFLRAGGVFRAEEEEELALQS